MADDVTGRQRTVLGDGHPRELVAGGVTALAEELELMPLLQVVEAAHDTCNLLVDEATY
jgi:hypothetical protein